MLLFFVYKVSLVECPLRCRARRFIRRSSSTTGAGRSLISSKFKFDIKFEELTSVGSGGKGESRPPRALSYTTVTTQYLAHIQLHNGPVPWTIVRSVRSVERGRIAPAHTHERQMSVSVNSVKYLLSGNSI